MPFWAFVLAILFIEKASAETCVKEIRHFSYSEAPPISRFPIASSRACVIKCIIQRSFCKSVVFYNVKRRSGRVCELYAVNSKSTNVKLERQIDGHGDLTTIYEVSDDCGIGQTTTSIPNMEGAQEFHLDEKAMVWKSWTSWTNCNKPCGGGTKSRSRHCSNCPPKKLGIQQQVRHCNQHSCADALSKDIGIALDNRILKSQNFLQQSSNDWGHWSSWTQCPNYCPATKSRRRKCNSYQGCLGATEEHEQCVCSGGVGQQPDSYGGQQQATWSSWTSWGQCATSCGSGTKTRSRQCSLPNRCRGDDAQSQPCSTGISCSVSRWSPWGPWSYCSASCGYGQRTRSRSCSGGSTGGGYGGSSSGGCAGQSSETDSCNAGTCAYWKPWGGWSPCSSSCGEGSHSRKRYCSVQGQCQGLESDTEDCYNQRCPNWNTWGAWSHCDVTCGKGYHSRTRTCTHPNQCSGPYSDKEICFGKPCPQWYQWGQWGTCSVTCGQGERVRTRVCDGLSCTGASRSSTVCTEGPCPHWTSWGYWQSCSVTCGGGIRKRERHCQYGTSCLGLSSEIQHCDAGACPTWGPFTAWTTCDVTCGRGNQVRTRECIYKGPISSTSTHGKYAGSSSSGSTSAALCTGEPSQYQHCHQPLCPVWSAWTGWSLCSVTCGKGRHTKTRLCLYGTTCRGDEAIVAFCSLVPCNTWSDWSRWSECSVTCGNGERTRTRTCEGINGKKCLGSPYESNQCDRGPCPVWGSWNSWGHCSSTCGQGQRRRERSCLANAKTSSGKYGDGGSGIVGGGTCSGQRYQSDACNYGNCPTWYQWTSWSQCSVSCGSGSRSRSRTCSKGNQCHGNSRETTSCVQQNCFTQQQCYWSQWSSCTVSCGFGHQQRECVGSSNSYPSQCQCSTGTSGSPFQTRPCEAIVCTGYILGQVQTSFGFGNKVPLRKRNK